MPSILVETNFFSLGQCHVYVFGKIIAQKPLFLYDLKNCTSENLNYLNLEMLEVVGGIGRTTVYLIVNIYIYIFVQLL